MFGSSSLTDSLVASDSDPDLSNISCLTLASPKSESGSTDCPESKPICVASIINNLRACGYNNFGESSDSDTTLTYPMMCDDERNAERGSAGSSTNPSAFNPEMRSLFREIFSELSIAVNSL